jgi:hypothetical protein
MRTYGRIAAGALGAVFLAGALSFGGATAASAAVTEGNVGTLACYPGSIRTSGASVSYTECNNNGSSRVWGTVRDTDADGQCAYVTVAIGTFNQDYRVCGEGNSAGFDTGYHGGNDAQVWLSER